MKLKAIRFGAALLACVAWGSRLNAQEAARPPAAIGVYDSRVVASPHFWAPEQQKKLSALAAAAQAAQAHGDTNQLRALKTSLQEGQKQIHQQVFGAAPIDNVMAALKDRLPALQKEAGVTRLVSKWDTQALAPLKDTPQVDVTDRLVQEFKPGPKQLQVIADLKKQ